MAKIRVGISGWRYKEWRGVFYPRGLRQSEELAFAAKQFGSIEINGSFYSLQRPAAFEKWRAETPPGFCFAVKGGRYITHMKKLRDVRPALANFLASGPLALEDKLGPILWQFPENMPSDLERFEAFFRLLPRDTEAASALAREHAPWMVGRVFVHVRSSRRRKLRHAVEIRNAALATPQFVALLRRHGIALVIADSAGHFPYFEDITGDFVYVRLHGDEKLYASGYTTAAIARWAERIAAWNAGAEPADARRIAGPPAARASGRDVYVYFDNDMHGHAPVDALALQRALEDRGAPVEHSSQIGSPLPSSHSRHARATTGRSTTPGGRSAQALRTTRRAAAPSSRTAAGARNTVRAAAGSGSTPTPARSTPAKSRASRARRPSRRSRTRSPSARKLD